MARDGSTAAGGQGRIEERPLAGRPGPVALASTAVGLVAGIVLLVPSWWPDPLQGPLLAAGVVVLVLVGTAVAAGLVPVAPGAPRVVTLFGHYRGTIREPGLRWVHPLAGRTVVSTRVRNHETGVLKVNDADGSPVEVATVVVWHVADTARAMFAVEDVERFVAVQADTALRRVAGAFSYARPGDTSLRGTSTLVGDRLLAELAERTGTAGVTVLEARLTRLAYSREVALALLQRQRAAAVVAARREIVDGAVGTVQLALDRIDADNMLELDEDRRAAMVSNLIVVLCSDPESRHPHAEPGPEASGSARLPRADPEPGPARDGQAPRSNRILSRIAPWWSAR